MKSKNINPFLYLSSMIRVLGNMEIDYPDYFRKIFPGERERKRRIESCIRPDVFERECPEKRKRMRTETRDDNG